MVSAVTPYARHVPYPTPESLTGRRDTHPGRRAPRPGDPAPDFRLERLDGKGQRTGSYERLRDHLDKPVALVFGSYT